MINLKRLLQLSLIAVIALCSVQISQANTYTFQPTPADMGDLDHNYYYSWKINWSLPAGETITSATLVFRNIWDWQYHEPDILYIHLLDSPPALATVLSYNLSRGYDNENSGDYWNGKGPLIGTWSDPNGGYGGFYKVPYLSFSLPSSDALYADLIDLNNFIANDGKFGFGLDPDCHYYNDWIKFKITTTSAPVPEPTILLLLGGALTGLFLYRKKLNKQ